MRRLVVLIGVVMLFWACGAPPRTAIREGEVSTATSAIMPTATATATQLPTATATATPPPTTTPTPVATPTPPPDATPLPEEIDDVNDVASLRSGTGPPTPVATPTLQVPKPSEPIRIQIPAIGLDERPLSVGLDKRHVPIVPKHEVGWYNLGAMPGQGENIVMWGHVLRWQDSPHIPAPFARLKELKAGASIIVTTDNGVEHRYRVIQQLQVRPDQVKYILPLGHERLTLVSCIGDNVIVQGFVAKPFRLLTIAEPVP